MMMMSLNFLHLNADKTKKTKTEMIVCKSFCVRTPKIHSEIFLPIFLETGSEVRSEWWSGLHKKPSAAARLQTEARRTHDTSSVCQRIECKVWQWPKYLTVFSPLNALCLSAPPGLKLNMELDSVTELEQTSTFKSRWKTLTQPRDIWWLSL